MSVVLCDRILVTTARAAYTTFHNFSNSFALGFLSMYVAPPLNEKCDGLFVASIDSEMR